MSSQVTEAPVKKSAFETAKEILWRELAEDRLILAYVPDVENYSREDALKLALERDKNAALDLANSTQTALDLEKAAKAVRKDILTDKQRLALKELGFDPTTY